MEQPRLSVVIPVLNEGEHLGTLLPQLRHPRVEVIVVDGGSSDDSVAIATAAAVQVLCSQRGRAAQMNVGAAAARGEWLWFLHGDSALTASIAAYLDVIETGGDWGFFPVCLSGAGWPFRLIERAMAWRSRLSSVATGDQGMFVARVLFSRVGGYEELPLMEDIALSKRLRRLARPAVPPIPLQTSSRRWEQRGIYRTVALMWRLRLLYFLGVSPRRLARQYR